eukprot:scaffold120756_cov33-Tisochrysis_lutea.AAC.1
MTKGDEVLRKLASAKTVSGDIPPVVRLAASRSCGDPGFCITERIRPCDHAKLARDKQISFMACLSCSLT